MQSDSQNHEMDCYENELPDFGDFSMKKHKLSDSSLQRVTPDSGIVLSYQSSVSSVGSLSPPVDKTSCDEFGKSYQSENSDANSHGETTTVASSHSTNPITSNVTNYPILSVASSPGQSPSHPMKGSAHAQNVIGAGPKSLMYGPPGLTSPMPATSPGMMHSSPAMMHSAVHNTAFPFNSPTAVNPSHHYPGHAQSFNSYPSQPAMFSPAGITSPNMYNHSRPYANGPFSNSALPQPPSYRPYPQSPAHRSYHPSSSYPGNNSPNMISPSTIQKYPITPPSLSTVTKSSSLASQVSKADQITTTTTTSPPPLHEIVSPKAFEANHKEPEAEEDTTMEPALQVKTEDDKPTTTNHEEDQESSEQQFYTKRYVSTTHMRS